MAQSMTFSTSISGADIGGQETVVISGEAKQVAGPTLLAAQGGNLTTHTTNTSGTITMDSADHTITTGMRVDLYWDGGQCYGATVGTVSGTTVPIASVAGGDNLPASLTDITVSPAISVDMPFSAADLKAIAAQAPTARSYFVMHDGTYNLNPIYLDPTDDTVGSLYYWHNELGTTNPLLGDTPTTVYISHADETRSNTTSKLAIITGD